MLIAKSYHGIGNMLVANAISVAWDYLVVFIKTLLLGSCNHIGYVSYLLPLATVSVVHCTSLLSCALHMTHSTGFMLRRPDYTSFSPITCILVL